MDSSIKKPTSNPSKTKLSKTFQKVIHLKTSTKSFSQTGFRLLMPQEKPKRDFKSASQNLEKDQNAVTKRQNIACLEAFVAQLFAGLSGVKASYAVLQLAQFPYNGEAIQSADKTMVSDLKALLELKQSFSIKQIDSSPPHVTILLSEIQEQQSMMKMYEITIKKMQNEIEFKKAKISFLKKDLNGSISNNKSIEKRLNSSGCFFVIDSIKLSDPNPNNFMVVLQYVLRSARSFVKLMIREMEFVGWDIDQAANSIQPDVIFSKSNHKCFAFESFICSEIFDGFDLPDFSLPDESSASQVHERCSLFSDQFKNLKSVNPIRFLKHNPNSSFGKFTRFKYLRLVHPKMEESFSGNLNSRKMICSGAFPETGFFTAFAEMAKRVWLLHCLAFAFDHREVNLFQVRKNCRFSEVYMEGVNDDVLSAAGDSTCSDFVVAFTVVPGFKIGETVIQSQVYLSPAETPAR